MVVRGEEVGLGYGPILGCNMVVATMLQHGVKGMHVAIDLRKCFKIHKTEFRCEG